jgi:hypothetical protein
MRDTVEGFIARGGNVAFLSGNTSCWQVRLEEHTPEGPAASMVGYRGQFKDDPVYGTERQARLTTMWSDHLLGRPENLMTGSASRGAGITASASGSRTERAATRSTDQITGCSRGPASGTATCWVRRPPSWGTSVTAATSPTATAVRTRPVPTAARPPRPHEPSEIEFIAARLFGTRDPAAVDRIEAGHAVFGTYTSPGGGTVVTSGCTDWAHGLTGRDPQVEQITANLLDRLA